MFKQFVILLLTISFLETTASPTLQQDEPLLNQFTKVYSTLKNSGYSDSEITQLLLSTPELASLGNVKRLKKNQNTALYCAIGAGIGVATVAAGAACCYGYAQYQETKKTTLKKGMKQGSEQHKDSLKFLPLAEIDLPRTTNLSTLDIKDGNGRGIENLRSIGMKDSLKQYEQYGRFTPLHYAAHNQDASANDIKEILETNKIQKDSDFFNMQSKKDSGNINSNKIKQVYSALEGSTPLALAALAHSKDKVDLFLEYGSDPAIKDCNGNTALHNAVANIKQSDTENADSGNKAQLEMVQTLINANKQVLKTKNNAGFTPLEYMTAREKTRVTDDKRTERAQKQFNALSKLLS